MATYIPAYKGYVTDVPELWFKRKDGKMFHYDQLTQASFTPNVNFTEVNAGWSLFPVAYLPGQSTMEMQATSGQFNADLFAMANNQTFEAKQYGIPYSAVYEVADNAVVIESKESIANADFVINGMVKGDAAAPAADGKEATFAITETAPEAEGGVYKTTIALPEGAVEGEIEVTYVLQKDAHVVEINNKTAAVGELIAKWPVYATGDESDAAGVKGYVLMKVYKCRVTAMPGFDTSYKSAATNSVTFSALDPKRPDENIYNIAYIEK